MIDNLKIYDRVYFGRGPFEFVGIVTVILPNTIFVEGVGLFHFEALLTEDEKKQLVNSSINICITNLRSYINTITSFYILGRFSFHAVDMPALLKSKADSINRDVNTDK